MDAAEAAPDTPGFDALPLRSELLDTLAALGHDEPTPVQREAIPPMIEGRDLLGQAATGTGKTAAFTLPVLQRMEQGRSTREPMALILAPTRELAVQVSEAVQEYGKRLGVRVVAVFGGQPIGRQLHDLKRGVDVVVATPGRALDHINRGTLNFDALEIVVLDEADEMLDLGFIEDIETILEQVPDSCQTALFSATMPERIESIVDKHLDDPVRVQIARQVTPEGEAPLVRQSAYVVPRGYKPAALGRLLEVESPSAAIVFCRTREETDQVTEALVAHGQRAEALHGGMSQEQRDRVMGRVRTGATQLLVATDVAARGLDIDHLTHVVNFNVPAATDSYVHRVGRVGRAGREGVAITLVETRQRRQLKNIQRVTGYTITVEPLPTIEQVRARRLQRAGAVVREQLAAEDLERYGAGLDELSAEFDLRDIALAAMRLAHQTLGRADEEEIPEVSLDDRRPRGTRDGREERGGARGERRGRPPAAGMTRLFVSVGRGARVRPRDLVGAITGESDLRGRDIGAIEIADRFSLVEVPAAAADDVIAALKGSTIQGRKALVRRDAK